MKTRQLLTVFALFLLFSQSAVSQTNGKTKYLQQVGILDSISSKALNQVREFYVQLPDSYNPESDKKYPVAFIIDGDALLPAVHNAQSFYYGGFTPEMILIGIANAENRRRDLTISKVTTLFGQPYNGESGEAENFISFIDGELIPYVEDKYPASSFRTLIGHSYGGLFTVYTMLNHPELFNNYIAIDPSLQWDDQILLKDAKEKLKGADYRGKSFFMSLNGQLHGADPSINIDNVMEDTSEPTLFARSNISFYNILKENPAPGLAFDWKFYPRDLHGTIPYPSIMDGLIFDFKWFQMEDTDKINTPETPKEELFELVNYRADKLENYFGYAVEPYPEDLLNALGYMSLDTGQPEKSRMFFEFGIQFFPKSSNAYDSMSEFYERTGDNVNALKFARKAFEISGSDYYKRRIETLEGKN